MATFSAQARAELLTADFVRTQIALPVVDLSHLTAEEIGYGIDDIRYLHRVVDEIAGGEPFHLQDEGRGWVTPLGWILIAISEWCSQQTKASYAALRDMATPEDLADRRDRISTLLEQAVRRGATGEQFESLVIEYRGTMSEPR